MSIKIIIFSKLLNYPIIINYNVNLFNIYIKLCSATKLSYELFIVYKSTQNGSVPLVWPAKDLNKNFYQFPFSHPKQNKPCSIKVANENSRNNSERQVPVILSMKIFAHCREVSQFQMGKTLVGIFTKYCENHMYWILPRNLVATFTMFPVSVSGETRAELHVDQASSCAALWPGLLLAIATLATL